MLGGGVENLGITEKRPQAAHDALTARPGKRPSDSVAGELRDEKKTAAQGKRQTRRRKLGSLDGVVATAMIALEMQAAGRIGDAAHEDEDMAEIVCGNLEALDAVAAAVAAVDKLNAICREGYVRWKCL